MVTTLAADTPPKKGHRDLFRAYYTEDQALVSYMVDLLDPRPSDSCLEPCAGSGLFVDEIISRFPSIRMDVVEISGAAATHLRNRFANYGNVNITEIDYLAPSDLFSINEEYDKIVANPPYGAWQDLAKRKNLKRQFPDLYVKESATLFLAKAVATLRQGGRAVFILPETFLFSHSQRSLRKRILDSCVVETIDVFPSSLFPNVNFGYARLSIVSVLKGRPLAEHLVEIRQASSTNELVARCGRLVTRSQNSIASSPELSFPVNGTQLPTTHPSVVVSTLGDLADCVTGFYSGDDARFLKRAISNDKYATRYSAVSDSQVARITSPCLHGLAGEKHFVPVLKGGGFAYMKPTLWYLNWSESAVRHYRTDKKARFQNSLYYFRRGIGFPMVSSGGARASVIQPDHIFDQSVVGIFPRDCAHFAFLLAFLNSSSAWSLLRQINPSANNSARYMRRIPVLLPTESELLWYSEVIESYLTRLTAGCKKDDSLELLINQRISKLLAPLF
jgi:adenine-specific DNA-methyltransferase